MVAVFHQEAQRRKFFIVAPDSRVAPDGQYSWQVGDRAGEITDDLCAREGLRGGAARDAGCADRPGARAHRGVLRGGSLAPYVATRRGAVHGVRGASRRRIPRRVRDEAGRGWMSTGLADVIRPVAGVAVAASAVKDRGIDLTMSTFPGGHEMGAGEVSGATSRASSVARAPPRL